MLKIALLSLSRTFLGTNEIGCPWVKLCLEVVTLGTSPLVYVPLNQFDSFAHLHIIPLVQSTHRDATDEALYELYEFRTQLFAQLFAQLAGAPDFECVLKLPSCQRLKAGSGSQRGLSHHTWHFLTFWILLILFSCHSWLARLTKLFMIMQWLGFEQLILV